MSNFSNIQLKPEVMPTYAQVDGLSLQNLFQATFSTFPNCYMFTQDGRESDYYFDVDAIMEFLKEQYPPKEITVETTVKKEFGEEKIEETKLVNQIEIVVYTTKNLTTKKSSHAFCAVIPEEKLFFRIEREISESYILYDFKNTEELDALAEKLVEFRTAPEEKENRIHKIAYSSTSGYYLKKATIKDLSDLNVSENYNDNFLPEYNKIKEFLGEDDKSGLVFLGGVRGTGKTYLIRHLISTFKQRKFVFVPSTMTGHLGQPDFVGFLETLQDSVLILEDAEGAIRDRNAAGADAGAVSTLLNLADGLQSDELGLKFICTYNTEEKNIDEALLRKGRTISKYWFKELSLDKTKALLTKFFVDNPQEGYKVEDIKDDINSLKDGLTLADIYNFLSESYEDKRRTLGF